MKMSRRGFMIWLGRGMGVLGLGAMAVRILKGQRPEAEFVQPPHRYGWQINPDQCRFCTVCETACVRRPSAVKAVNDPIRCPNCVVCYGHIYDHHLASSRIDTEGRRVCPHDAVRRKLLCGGLDGFYLYTIDPDRCTGCGRCALECNRKGNRSMFLIIRPDLCLGCNECAIARACPHGAVERVPLAGVDDYHGESYYPPGTGAT